MKPVQIFLTHPPEALRNYYGKRALAQLEVVGKVVVNPLGRVLSAHELVDAAQGCQIIISDRQTPGERTVFESLPDLVAFVRVAVDIRNIDVEAASANGVLVTHASPGFVQSVAEWVIGAMIDLARHTSHYTMAYRHGRVPEARMGVQLAGSTLGVIGYGAIGRYVCRLGLAMGMRVLVDDPYVRIEDPSLMQVNLDRLLDEADFVVCLAVANAETEGMMGSSQFARMRPTAYFINASRGNLVDEAALARALDERRIAGAALDVGRAPDQMPSPELARRDNVVATPHVAGLTPPAVEHQALETARQAAEIAQGRVPVGAVNPDRAVRLA
ncbi:MAG TPA: NAD(P)-dependent oxidoreductase, partial [Alphaproteobacteria bacterium]